MHCPEEKGGVVPTRSHVCKFSQHECKKCHQLFRRTLPPHMHAHSPTIDSPPLLVPPSTCPDNTVDSPYAHTCSIVSCVLCVACPNTFSRCDSYWTSRDFDPPIRCPDCRRKIIREYNSQRSVSQSVYIVCIDVCCSVCVCVSVQVNTYVCGQMNRRVFMNVGDLFHSPSLGFVIQYSDTTASAPVPSDLTMLDSAPVEKFRFR